MNASEIVRKLEAFSHREVDRHEFKDVKEINKKIKNCLDLFDRPITYISLQDSSSLPEPLKEFNTGLET